MTVPWLDAPADSSSSFLSLSSLQEMMDRVQAAAYAAYVPHGSSGSPHIFNPRVLDGRDSLCMVCGVPYSTLRPGKLR